MGVAFSPYKNTDLNPCSFNLHLTLQCSSAHMPAISLTTNQASVTVTPLLQAYATPFEIP
jgi:hypothetical protein